MNSIDDVAIATTTAVIERTTATTGLTYPELVAAFEREVGHWDVAAGNELVARNASWSEVEQQTAYVGGPHAMMILAKINLGAITSLSGKAKLCSLYMVGNPVIANEIVSLDLSGSLYVPFRVCLYDNGDPGGACITYDRPSSFLAVLGRQELTEIGVLLDGKIDAITRTILRQRR